MFLSFATEPSSRAIARDPVPGRLSADGIRGAPGSGSLSPTSGRRRLRPGAYPGGRPGASRLRMTAEKNPARNVPAYSTRTWSVIQLTSHVLPPSSEKDCSKCGDFDVVPDQT